ncbi:MAG TPA: hypothetical protein VIJ34_01670, partial [Acidimicrobiales bacterium]
SGLHGTKTLLSHVRPCQEGVPWGELRPNGDVNPYGVAVVPASEGTLVKGDTLVSNFNDKGNVQGTGTPITQISPSGVATTSSKIGPLSTKTCPARSGSRPRSPC